MLEVYSAAWASGRLFKLLGIQIDPSDKVEHLSVAYMQMVEIAKAIIKDVKILIMDEPTAPLTTNEVEVLYGIVASLKEKGVTIIYISHRLNEIYDISDRLTVLRDGEVIATRDTADTTREELIRMMVQRETSETFPRRNHTLGDVALDVRGLTGSGVRDLSFSLRAGEVLGLGGLIGAGRTETARMIFGADPIDSGEVRVNGKPAAITSPETAMRYGIGLVPEDRKQQGVILGLSIRDNISLPILQSISHLLVVDTQKENTILESQKDALRIKTPSMDQLVRNLSGGNQQKVALSKWLVSECRILIFDEPTRGIDVGAKQEIYALINRLSASGIAILMISSEMEELMGMTDRMVVLSEGRMTGILEQTEYTQEKILTLASGYSE